VLSGVDAVGVAMDVSDAYLVRLREKLKSHLELKEDPDEKEISS